jgi:hypothetical protein
MLVEFAAINHGTLMTAREFIVEFAVIFHKDPMKAGARQSRKSSPLYF